MPAAAEGRAIHARCGQRPHAWQACKRMQKCCLCPDGARHPPLSQGGRAPRVRKSLGRHRELAASLVTREAIQRMQQQQERHFRGHRAPRQQLRGTVAQACCAQKGSQTRTTHSCSLASHCLLAVAPIRHRKSSGCWPRYRWHTRCTQRRRRRARPGWCCCTWCIHLRPCPHHPRTSAGARSVHKPQHHRRCRAASSGTPRSVRCSLASPAGRWGRPSTRSRQSWCPARWPDRAGPRRGMGGGRRVDGGAASMPPR